MRREVLGFENSDYESGVFVTKVCDASGACVEVCLPGGDVDEPVGFVSDAAGSAWHHDKPQDPGDSLPTVDVAQSRNFLREHFSGLVTGSSILMLSAVSQGIVRTFVPLCADTWGRLPGPVGAAGWVACLAPKVAISAGMGGAVFAGVIEAHHLNDGSMKEDVPVSPLVGVAIGAATGAYRQLLAAAPFCAEGSAASLLLGPEAPPVAFVSCIGSAVAWGAFQGGVVGAVLGYAPGWIEQVMQAHAD